MEYVKNNDQNRNFQQSISAKFTPKNVYTKFDKKVEISNMDKKAIISRILSTILLRPSKKVLEKSKFFQKKDKNLTEISNNKDKQLYVQVFFFKSTIYYMEHIGRP